MLDWLAWTCFPVKHLGGFLSTHTISVDCFGYIFATNRLRENVGASQRIWQAGVEFTCRAAEAVTKCADFEGLLESAGKDPATHAFAMAAMPRIDDGAAIEVVVATSGKALFLARERKHAEDVVACATRMAVEEAPGLSLRGAVVPITGCDASAADTAVRKVHEELEVLRDRLPAPEIRFPTLPVLEPCASSGLPAARIVEHRDSGRSPTAYSDVTLAKRGASKDGYRRISQSIDRSGHEQDAIARTVGDLKKHVDWIGIVHADGNGIGQLFLEFGKICGETTLRGYFDAYREFSSSLDLCGVAAFRAALGEMDSKVPLLPLVLGGDDLTVICDGRIAARFAAAYLTEFQKQTTQCNVLARPSVIPKILRSKNNKDADEDWTSLGAAAGVAITKPHYPFHRGYELAEELLKQAKTAKNKIGVSRCALDFHVLFDGAETSLDDLRERWTLTSTHSLTARPYVLGEDGDGENPWARHRQWRDVQEAATALRDSSTLARSQQYALRAALFRGPEAADRQLALIRHRYRFRWETVAAKADGTWSLFFPIDGGSACRLLDALELADLEPGGKS